MPGQLETLWQDIRDELRREVPDFNSTSGSSRSSRPGSLASTLYVRAPEHIRTSVAERYLPLLRRVAERLRRRPARARDRRRGLERRPGRAPASPPSDGRGAGPQPQVQLRAVRDRRGQPLRPRRRAGRRRAARPGLQPALPPRRARARQDAPAPRHRAATSTATAAGCACATPRSRSSPASSWARSASAAPRASRTASAPRTWC